MKGYEVVIEKDGPGRYFIRARQGAVVREWSPRQLVGGHHAAAQRKARTIRAKLAAGVPLTDLR